VDALVQIGTGYALPQGSRYVTYEDITIVQALRLGYPDWTALSRRGIAAALDRQRRAYEGAAACCLTTSWAADSVVADYGIPRDKVHAVGVGRNYSPAATERDWTTPRYLFVGRDWHGKNGPGLLRAFARVREVLPAARLDVAGNHPPIEAEGVTGHGFLRMGEPAERRRAERLYQSATCFVLPSHYEASAIAYVEACSAGLPCIGTTRGGSADLIGHAGMLVDPGDDEALASAMLALADPVTAAQLGNLAQARSENFTWRLVAERLLRALALPSVSDEPLAEFLQPPSS
jgi:glycogen synthase